MFFQAHGHMAMQRHTELDNKRHKGPGICSVIILYIDHSLEDQITGESSIMTEEKGDHAVLCAVSDVNAGECSAPALALKPEPRPDSDSLSMQRAPLGLGMRISSELSGQQGA